MGVANKSIELPEIGVGAVHSMQLHSYSHRHVDG